MHRELTALKYKGHATSIHNANSLHRRLLRRYRLDFVITFLLVAALTFNTELYEETPFAAKFVALAALPHVAFPRTVAANTLALAARPAHHLVPKWLRIVT